MPSIATVAEELVKELDKNHIEKVEDLHHLKNLYCAKYKITPIPNIQLIEAYKNLRIKKEIAENKGLEKLIRKRGVRSQSGIASITVITKQFPCPGKCVFCPTEPKMPKSYMSNEPAIMRAILNDFDAYRQTLNRLDGLTKTGHHTDKVDVIISGGTFSFYPKRYQTKFVTDIYNALNYPLPKSRSLIEAQKLNETANNRCIGLSVETRPDHIDEKELLRLRRMGCTKIEIGIQSLNDEVLKKNKRGHGVEETKKALQLMRDAGYKINAHMMPNLYGSNSENDYKDFVELFNNPAFRPDWLKIYPCMVVPWSQLEKIYEKGGHKPYSDEDLKALIIKIKQIVPRYVRITRLYRDIPAPTIIAGSKLSNLRQLIHMDMKKMNIKCNCIRCREIKGQKVYGDKVQLHIEEYEASLGKEFFITFNDVAKDKLCSLLRLRFHSYALKGSPHFIRELDGATLIREVHTYGEQVKVASKSDGTSQHIGLGKRMMMEAEKISKMNGFKKVAVISGIGVREYYKKLGYRLEGTYMVKYI
jgi:elongator complex protein 3